MVLVLGKLECAAGRDVDGCEVEDARHDRIQIHHDGIKIGHAGSRDVQCSFMAGRPAIERRILRLRFSTT